MDIRHAIFSRRSIRHFKNIPVPPEIIKEVLECGSWAPSACNRQGWRFIVIDNADLKQKIVGHGASRIILQAPVGILTCYDNRSDNHEYLDWLQSAAAAIENMLLGAQILGLGSCWICHLPNHGTLRALLKIPSFYTPIAYVAIGYPLEQPKPIKRRLLLQDLYEYNRFPRIHNSNCSEYRFLGLRRIIRKCYYALPFLIKKRLNNFIHRHFVKTFDN